MGTKKLITAKQRNSSRLISPTARFPPEICDMIIDFLYSDKSSLATCSLVCRSWLRAARYHLFETIYVHCDKDVDAFCNFLTYLQSTPTIRPYIKDLCFDGYTDKDDLQDNLESTYLAAVTYLLPQLHTVALVNCQWGRPKDSGDDFIHRKTIAVRSLYINSFVADSESRKNKLRILQQFSVIGHLHLANVWLGHFGLEDDEEEEDTAEDIPLSPATQVMALSLSMANICLNFLEYLRIQPFVKSLDSLRIIDLFHAEYLLEHQDLVFVGELLRDKVNTSLLEFSLELPRLVSTGLYFMHSSCHVTQCRFTDSADVYSLLHLSSCVTLTNVFLRMPCRTEVDVLEAEFVTHDQGTQVDGVVDDATPALDAQPPAASAPAAQTRPVPDPFTAEEWRAPSVIFSQLPPSTKMVSLDIELEGTPEAVRTSLENGPAWKELERALLQLPSLEKVFIRRVKEKYPFVALWTKAQHELILRKLPALQERKLLLLHWYVISS